MGNLKEDNTTQAKRRNDMLLNEDMREQDEGRVVVELSAEEVSAVLMDYFLKLGGDAIVKDGGMHVEYKISESGEFDGATLWVK